MKMKNGKVLLDDNALEAVNGGTPWQTAWMNFALLCGRYIETYKSEKELVEFFAQHGWKYVINDKEDNYVEKDGLPYDHDLVCDMAGHGLLF